MIFFNTIGYALGNAQLTLIRLTVPHERLSNVTSLSSGIMSISAQLGPRLPGCHCCGLAITWSYHQETVAAEHMGRVAGITGAIFKIGMPPVIILAGLISDAVGVTEAFGLAAAINVAAALFLVWPAGWGWPVVKPG